jgi:UDP-N-acetylmuramoyl-L-alanyl-D-glutamate--2,6-diaminopimelate ligase
MQLDTLLASLEHPPISMHHLDELSQHIEITALAYDSRLVKPGGLFIAVPGTHTDGRRYLTDAAQHGALAALGPRIDVNNLPLPYRGR